VTATSATSGLRASVARSAAVRRAVSSSTSVAGSDGAGEGASSSEASSTGSDGLFVLPPHETVVYLRLTVERQGDDGSCLRHLFRRPCEGFGLQLTDAPLDRFQAGGDGGIFLAVFVVLGIEQLLLFRTQAAEFRQLCLRHLDFLLGEPVEFAKVAVTELRACLDPAPVFGADGFGEGGELVGKQSVEQGRILRVAAGAVVEQVAAHRASGGLVGGGKADEAQGGQWTGSRPRSAPGG
jgi:hypothetical protein